MNGLTLKQLRYFAALSDTQHFARAAAICSISQPALSVQIKQLEELMGAPLVERNTRNVRLTALGKLIAERAHKILRSVDEIGDVVRATRGELAGPFRLGVIPTIAPYLLPEVVMRLMERFPKLDIILRETMTPTLVDQLHRGEIDAAILALPISEPAFTEEHLFSENFLLVRPESDAGLPVPNVSTLQEMKLLLLEEGHCFRDQALTFCGLKSERYRNIMEGSSLTTLVQLVSAGVGVTLIPEMAAKIEARLAKVDLVQFPSPQPSRNIGMVWRKTTPLEPQLLIMSDVVRVAAMHLRDAT